MQTPLGSLFRFGPFQVNSATGELLKNGNRIKLQEQPFRLLVVLLESPGELVTREELRHRIWRDNTFVDFDSSFRVAVRKLREALGDDAENPRYVETIPKRGYRFLAPETYPATDPDVYPVPAEIAAPSPEPVVHASSQSWKWTLASILLLVVIGVVLIASRSFGIRKVLTEKDTVVLADFVNSTGDPVFDETLRQGLAVQLQQSPFLTLVSEQRIRQALRLMGSSPEVQITGHVAQDLCERTGSAAYLEGSIKNIGADFVLNLRSTDCRTGEVLDEEQVQIAKKEEVLGEIGQMANRFRTKVGESLSTIREHDTPLEEATTPSLEALKAYSLGWKILGQRGEEATIPFFKNAVDIDPNFASAYAALALMYGATGSSDLATKNITKAYELRSRASDRERFFITAYYFGRGTGNQEKAQETCEQWAQTYPREFLPHAFLAGFVFPVLANYEKGIEEARKAIELDPDKVVGYLLLGNDSIALNRLTDAKDAVRRVSERKAESPLLSVLRYDIAFLEDDRGGMQKEVNAAQGHSDAADWMQDREAFASASSGQLAKARDQSQRAVELAQQAGNPERAALFQAREALREGFFGNAAEARRGAKAALNLARNREVEYGGGVALAVSGGANEAESIANDLEKRYPDDTSVRFNYVPVIRALLALSRNDSSKALNDLQRSVPYELGSPRSAQTGFFGSLYPIYVRGLAYLSANNGEDAASEFQKILDHQGIVTGDPVGSLARLQLARAYALSGETAKARSAYRDFLTLWKDADSGTPLLKQARIEYAKLH